VPDRDAGVEPSDVPAADPVARRAETTPERLALLDADRDRSWSYRAYDDLVTAYADAVRTRGANTVAVLASASPAVAALSLAAFRGACRLALLHRPDARPQHQAKLDRVDPDLLVCGPETRETALAVTDDGASCPVATVGAESDGTLESVADPSEAVPSAAGSSASADAGASAGEIVLFTSGTTGEPQGVRLTAVNCLASAVGSAFRLGIESDQRWLAPLSMAHTGGLMPAYRCALYGTTVVVDGPFDRTDTAAAIDDAQITTVSLVPTMLERLLDAEWTPPDHLETVLLGGAAASPDLIERCEGLDVPVYPTYGATETASQVATATPTEAFAHEGTVGRPLLFTDLDVVDGTGAPCPPGEVGEIVVSGPTVTPGYLDGAATERAFDDRGRFHTRDRGYRDADGRLWVTGRLDDRIVTGGEVVQAEAVEAVLRSIDGVEAAAVVGVPDPEWGERVGALVVPADPDGGVSLDVIHEACRERLADYERPKTIALVDALPRTPSGTVDRDAVRQRLQDAPTE
jgi:O-succinylbenzoic acid--CoA ligase